MIPTNLQVLLLNYKRYCNQHTLDASHIEAWEDNYHSMIVEGDPFAYDMLYNGVNYFFKEAVLYVRRIGRYQQQIDDFEGQIVGNYTTSDQFENKGWLFITIGFDDKIITPSKMMWAVEKIKKIGKMDYTFFRYVHEKYRKDVGGKIYEHCHTHILVRTSKYKSDFIDQSFRFLSPLINGQKNFIDVKVPKDKVGNFSSKLKYILGDKQQSKLECIELDKKWRRANGLEEILWSPN